MNRYIEARKQAQMNRYSSVLYKIKIGKYGSKN